MKPAHMRARVVYFTKGSVPTDKEYEDAYGITPNVQFRNASLDNAHTAIEPVDAVAGAVPERYKKTSIPVVTSATTLKNALNPKKDAKGADQQPPNWGGNS